MANLWMNTYQNWMPSKPLIYHKIKEHKRFLAACGVLRGASLSTFEILDVARGQKRAFCSSDYWEFSKNFLNVFPETDVVLFTYYQR